MMRVSVYFKAGQTFMEEFINGPFSASSLQAV